MIIVVLRNFICLAGLVVAAPIFFLLSIFIFLEDGMPIFFIQKRIGLNKKIFKLFKIRTMKNNAPELGTHEVENSYQLKIGVIIRKIKIDELPQLINVIKGDINLVGPRPGLVNQEELTLTRSKKNIYDIKPGITGLAQILGYDMSNPSRLAEIDKIYMANKSYQIDCLILLGTFLAFPRKYLSSKLKTPKNN